MIRTAFSLTPKHYLSSHVSIVDVRLVSAWTLPTSASLLNSSPPSLPVIDRKTPTRSNNYRHPTSTLPNTRHSSPPSVEKNEPLTLHVHTHHHHHHIHNSNSSASSSFKPIHTLKDQRVIDTSSIIPLKITRVRRSQHAQSPVPVDTQALNLSVEPDSLNERKVKIPETRRRKSYLRAELKPDNPPAANSTRPNGGPSPSHPSMPRYVKKRRGVSATTPTTAAALDRSTRVTRTQSSSVIPTRSRSLADRKRSHSSTSVTLPVSQRSTSQRKKQKITHHWTLFGKFERQLVSIKVRFLLHRCTSTSRPLG